MDLVLILHNIRSAHNVGSIFRTADGIGVNKIYLTGYSALPKKEGSILETKAHKMVAKTALGAEKNIKWTRKESVSKLVGELRRSGYEIVGLEQAANSVAFDRYSPKRKVALLVGNEVRGLDRRLLEKCDVILEIPMRGKKNSLNVAVATGIAGYEIYKKAEN